MNINQRIKMLRKEMGLNQKDFGAKIGLGLLPQERMSVPFSSAWAFGWQSFLSGTRPFVAG